MNAAIRLNINGTPSTSEERNWLCAMVRCRPYHAHVLLFSVQGITLMLDFIFIFYYSYFQKLYLKFQEQRQHTFQRIRTVLQPRAAAKSREISSTLSLKSWWIGTCRHNSSMPASCVENNETEFSARK